MTELEFNEFVEKHLYQGLTNLNDGFDSPCNYYFSKEDFTILLQRLDRFGIRVHAIEPFPDKKFGGIADPWGYSHGPDLPPWHWRAFEDFQAQGIDSYFCAYFHTWLLEGDNFAKIKEKLRLNENQFSTVNN